MCVGVGDLWGLLFEFGFRWGEVCCGGNGFAYRCVDGGVILGLFIGGTM